MKTYLVLSLMIAGCASCCPIPTLFDVREANGNTVTHITDDHNQVELSITAMDAHYRRGNFVNIVLDIVNKSSDTLYFQGFAARLRTEQFNVRPGFSHLAKPAFLAPGGTLRCDSVFANAFKGSYKKFRNYLSKGKLFVRPANMKLRGRDLVFPEYELTVSQPATKDNRTDQTSVK